MADSKIEDVCVCQYKVLKLETIYIVDFKGATGQGGIEFFDSAPEYNSVRLDNPNLTVVESVAFEENAFKIKKGTFAKQCECLLYPEESGDNSWVLLIEMKYADNEHNIQRESWHEKAVEQIRSTVGFLKQKGVLSDGKKLNAIVSFPKLDIFSSWLTQYISNELRQDGIKARCTNKATIVNGEILMLA